MAKRIPREPGASGSCLKSYLLRTQRSGGSQLEPTPGNNQQFKSPDLKNRIGGVAQVKALSSSPSTKNKQQTKKFFQERIRIKLLIQLL
jgi:hypothetical protein